MAGPRTHRNPPFADNDELTGNAPEAPIKGSGTPSPTSAASKALTLAFAPILAFAPGRPGGYTDEP